MNRVNRIKRTWIYLPYLKYDLCLISAGYRMSKCYMEALQILNNIMKEEKTTCQLTKPIKCS